MCTPATRQPPGRHTSVGPERAEQEQTMAQNTRGTSDPTPGRGRWRRILAAGVVAAVTIGGAAAMTTVNPAHAATAPVRIMPLGDSITGGPGCWRAVLWQRLQASGYTNIDMVGTLPGGGCNVATWDGDNEGHGGYKATDVASQNLLVGWLATTKPDVVLMHFGTNDIWNAIPVSSILSAYTTLVDQMRASNPAMRIIVAQIIPMTPSGCANCAQEVVDLNAAIPSWAAGKSTAQSPIQVVDQWTGFDSVADTIGDGVHPNDAGFQKMSDRWYPPLATVLDALGGKGTATTTTTTSRPVTTTTTTTSRPVTTTTTTTSRPVTTTTSGSTGRTCTATYSIVGQWSGGFQGDVLVKAGTAISGWKLIWTFANGQVLSSAWGGTVTTSGAAVTATNLAWNGALAAGGTADVGFLASWTGSNTVPTVTCTAS